MKLLVIGIDRGSPEILFEDNRLSNIHHLMSFGCYGILEGAGKLQKGLEWLAVAASQKQVDNDNPAGVTIWEQIERQGKQAIVVRVPPGISYPEKMLETVNEEFEGERAGEEARETVVFEQNKEQVLVQSHSQFDFVRQLMRSEPWDYFQFVDTGLERLFRASEAVSDVPDQETIRDYYLYFDEQIGSIFELLEEDTTVLILSVPRVSESSGSFILAGASLPLSGFVEGVYPLDLAPTLLELGGYEIPGSMQGKSLVAGLQADTESGLSEEEEAVLRERLSGLGYF